MLLLNKIICMICFEYIYRKIKLFLFGNNYKDIKQQINIIAPPKSLNKNSIKKNVLNNKKNQHYYKMQKDVIIQNIEMNISQLHPISESLFEKGLKGYYDKIIDFIEQSEGFLRILKKLDLAKPYAAQIILTINKQTTAINQLIIKLYSD